MVIFDGVYQMERWFEPLSNTIVQNENGNPEWFNVPDWSSADGVVVRTPRGSK